MKYSELKDPHRRKYTWRLTDQDAFEFEMCDSCKSEAPLEDFESWDSAMTLCWICSHLPLNKSDDKIPIAAANAMLRATGAFDNHEVVPAGEERE